MWDYIYQPKKKVWPYLDPNIYKLFDIQMLYTFLKGFFKKLTFEKKKLQTTKHMKYFPACKELTYYTKRQFASHAGSFFLNFKSNFISFLFK